jgi:hypothetical protein
MGNGRQAMIFAIYYRPADGEILGWTTSANPVAPDGMMLAVFDEAFQPEPLNEKFDASENAVVEKTADEKHQSRLPTVRQVQEAVFAELRRTDQFMIADYPISDAERDGWKAYRKTLRALSDIDEPANMIDAWQLPPDGVDPITSLRERLQP